VKKASCLAHDIRSANLSGMVRGAGLIELPRAAHQPRRILQTIRGWKGNRICLPSLADRLEQFAVNRSELTSTRRQRVAVELEHCQPPSGPPAAHRHRAPTVCIRGTHRNFRPGFGSKPADFDSADHLGDVVIIDAAQFAQRGDYRAWPEIEMLDQRLHRPGS